MQDIVFSLRMIILNIRSHLLDLSLALRFEVFIYVFGSIYPFYQLLEVPITDIGGIATLGRKITQLAIEQFLVSFEALFYKLEMPIHVLFKFVKPDCIIILFLEHERLKVLLPSTEASLQVCMEFIKDTINLILENLKVALVGAY
jgi:hypothetical protein